MGLDVLKESGLVDLAGQLSGPVLAAGATALGFPEVAPLLMKAGPALTKSAFSAVQGAASALGGTGASSASSGTKNASSSESSGVAGDVDKKDLIELEHMQQKQQQMFSLLSNIMKGMHDTRMAVIGNIRS
jgi:hypothetical protein